jgi:hypothetical protein
MLHARLVIAILAASLSVTPLAAQGVFNMGMLTNTLSQGVNIQIEEERASSHQAFRSMLRPSRGPVRINPATAAFRPDMGERKRNMAGIVAAVRRADPAGADGLAAVLRQQDLIAAINRELPRAGLRANSVPDAMAYYLVTAWYGVRGSTDSKPADFRAVRDQFARAVGTTPGFANLGNAGRQRLAESMLTQGMIADKAVRDAQGNASQLRPIRSALNAGARQTFGFDLTQLRLGGGGLG